MNYQFDDLAYHLSQPGVTGVLKAQNTDFCVDEIMPVQPKGEGEHLWLKIEKNGSNTDWVAQQLARLAGLKSVAVSYAGMKDRHAVTTQWFSLHLPGMPDPDLSTLERQNQDSSEFRVLESIRHDRKLKRGALSGNRFRINITNLKGDLDSLQSSLEAIKQAGVPNYFGEQRFGREMGNLYKAEKMFQGEMKKLKKLQRGLYLSAARSWIFNSLISRRINDQNWSSPLKGEVYMLNGKSACFPDDDFKQNAQRLIDQELHLTGPLWGEGESMVTHEVLALEQELAQSFPLLCEGLEAARMKQERRAMRLIPDNMSWDIQQDQLQIGFDLPAGAFATMVLRECVKTE